MADTGPTIQPDEPAGADALLAKSVVLVVDDNSQNLELLTAFLESLPVKIVTAVDGVDARDWPGRARRWCGPVSRG